MAGRRPRCFGTGAVAFSRSTLVAPGLGCVWAWLRLGLIAPWPGRIRGAGCAGGLGCPKPAVVALGGPRQLVCDSSARPASGVWFSAGAQPGCLARPYCCPALDRGTHIRPQSRLSLAVRWALDRLALAGLTCTARASPDHAGELARRLHGPRPPPARAPLGGLRKPPVASSTVACPGLSSSTCRLPAPRHLPSPVRSSPARPSR